MNQGDNVKIKADKEYEGRLMPSPDDDIVVLKLKNGYNIGIKKSKIKSTQVIKPYKEAKIKISKSIVDSKLKTISILHTGGTIASKVDYKTGAVTAQFSPDELISMFPELKKYANIKSRLIANMMSENMTFSDYNLITKEIEKEIKSGTDGIIITHGTDTMHYTSSALTFMLEELPVPVILVGSQRSSDRGSSDANMNIVNAVYFMTNSDFSDVGVCMHGSSSDDYCVILPGFSARKMHSSRRDAFKAINTDVFAKVDYKKDFIKIVDQSYRKKSDKILVKPINEKIKVGILKQRTNMFAEEFFFYEKYDGLVIESTGLGNLPIGPSSKKIEKALSDLIKKGVVVVLSAQTIYGRLNLNVYENARRQQEMGILGNNNSMTTECTYMKLVWLLSNHKKDAKDLILKDLRGELRERTEFEPEFV